jgi:C-terminal processing protease CtpA/Prc
VLGERPDERNLASKSSGKTNAFDIIGLKVSGLNDRDGVKIISIENGSTAQQNGLRKDDVIVKIGRTSITTVEQYNEIMEAKESGDVIMLKIERNGNQTIFAFSIQ